jgi:hypothetical protein
MNPLAQSKMAAGNGEADLFSLQLDPGYDTSVRYRIQISRRVKFISRFPAYKFIISLYGVQKGIWPIAQGKKLFIIIISLLMSPLLGYRASFWITHKENGP